MEYAAFIARGTFSYNLQYPLQINGTSHFANDLGLDSLDIVEAVMAVEEVPTYDPMGKRSVSRCIADLFYELGIQYRNSR
jgi:hypothetical protein